MTQASKVGIVLVLAASLMSATELGVLPASTWSGRAAGQTAAPPVLSFETLAARLDALRRRWKVPGMTAAVAVHDAIVWQQGFGAADLAAKRPATPDTVYHLCSLTKPFATVVLLQLVEQGRLDLDDSAAGFGVTLPEGVTVHHLMTHTSSGSPGREYRYDGRRFGELDKVITKVTGQTFAAAVAERILRPLGLEDTAPNPLVPQACADAGRDASAVAGRMAQGYGPNGDDPVPYPARFLTAAGMVSTAADMARFSIALDGNRLLRDDTRAGMFTGARSTGGRVLPYGLGWFVQPRKPHPLVWHYGWWVGSSSLIVKVPARRLTFVVLANSDGLSHEFDLGKDDNVLRSPFARAFVDAVYAR